MSLAVSDTLYIYGKTNEHSGLEVIERALKMGCKFLDTADAYGTLTNERLQTQLAFG